MDKTSKMFPADLWNPYEIHHFEGAKNGSYMSSNKAPFLPPLFLSV